MISKEFKMHDKVQVKTDIICRDIGEIIRDTVWYDVISIAHYNGKEYVGIKHDKGMIMLRACLVRKFDYLDYL